MSDSLKPVQEFVVVNEMTEIGFVENGKNAPVMCTALEVKLAGGNRHGQMVSYRVEATPADPEGYRVSLFVNDRITDGYRQIGTRVAPVSQVYIDGRVPSVNDSFVEALRVHNDIVVALRNGVVPTVQEELPLRQ